MGIDKPEACNITGHCVDATRMTPIILSEFGSLQGPTLYNDTLQGCLRDFTTSNNISWAVWALAGSYRIRSGEQGVYDSWGLSNYNYTGWNYPEGIEGWFKPWVNETLG
jgi:hypothetical protein